MSILLRNLNGIIAHTIDKIRHEDVLTKRRVPINEHRNITVLLSNALALIVILENGVHEVLLRDGNLSAGMGWIIELAVGKGIEGDRGRGSWSCHRGAADVGSREAWENAEHAM